MNLNPNQTAVFELLWATDILKFKGKILCLNSKY